jgi:ankyrin repeat protein
MNFIKRIFGTKKTATQKPLAAQQSISNLKASENLKIGAFNGDYAMVKEALINGADINYKENGWTALMTSAQEGHIEIVKLLLSKGANVNISDPMTGANAYMASFAAGNHEISGLIKKYI